MTEGQWHRETIRQQAARIEALEVALQKQGFQRLLSEIVAAANKDRDVAAARIEELEAALREIIDVSDNNFLPRVGDIARAALDRDSA